MTKRSKLRTIRFVKAMKKLMARVDKEKPSFGITFHSFNGVRNFNRKQLENIINKHLINLGVR